MYSICNNLTSTWGGGGHSFIGICEDFRDWVNKIIKSLEGKGICYFRFWEVEERLFGVIGHARELTMVCNA